MVVDLDGLSPVDAAVALLDIIRDDNSERLGRIAEYRGGVFAPPYAPGGLTAEHRDLMSRSQQPWCAIPGKAVSQTLAVEGWRTPGAVGEALTDSPEWQVWQRSNLDGRSNVVHHAGADYGQAFVVSELRHGGQAYVRVLSSRHTAVLFEDVLSDDNAAWALSVLSYGGTSKSGKAVPGRAVLWDREKRYELSLDISRGPVVVSSSPHGGVGHNPVTRFVAQLDEDGRVVGEIEPIIPWQDSFNQALFNLSSVQTDTAFRIVFGTGVKQDFITDDDGRVVLDEFGKPVPVPVQMGPNTMITSTDPSSKFGVLEGSDQAGYVSALDMLVKQFSALTQTPPNFLLGTMANLSAEALEAAEKSFRRKVNHYQRAFGESWERALRVARVMEGEPESELLEHGEVVWTDFDSYNLVGHAQALGTLATQLSVPPRGLWPLVPGVSAGMLDEWGRLADASGDLVVASEYGEVDWGDSEPLVGDML